MTEPRPVMFVRDVAPFHVGAPPRSRFGPLIVVLVSALIWGLVAWVIEEVFF